MSDNTKIEWAHHTFNPWWGCAKVSAECDHCYAETWAKRVGYSETGSHFPIWGKEKRRRFFGHEHWQEPYRWNRKAMERGVHERVFCGSECDILEGRDDLDTPRLDLWQTIRETDWLYWLLLSKRPQNYRKALPRTMLPDPTVWLGTTVGCKSSLWRIDELRKTPASIRFLSCEPLLEDLGTSDLSGIHWVIVGGESGPGARPCHVEWIRSLVQQCKTEGVPVFVKQLGSKPERCMGINGALDLHRFAGAPIDKAYPLKLKNKKGGDPAEWPEDLRVREFPEAR